MIASAIIVLAWLMKKNQKIDSLPVLATCRFGTSEVFFSSANCLVIVMTVLENYW